MAGRTADISTSSFKPLDLNEIMMVPLARQKQEDEMLAMSGKLGELEANTLGADSERANEILSGFKDKASALSEDVINRGVSREQFNKLRNLRSESQKEFSSGFLGSAISNKKSAAAYINKMATDKMSQAGWSPKEAQQWAMYQVNQFGGTMKDDGTFNSFQGKQLAAKVDENKWLKDTIASVAKDISKDGMRYIEVGGLPAFNHAYQTRKIEKKDFNKVMLAITTNASTSPDLLASLQQQAFFTGAADADGNPLGEENPLDIGKFIDVKGVDSEGNEIITKEFVAGKSRFGRKALGQGYASSYRNLEIDQRIIQDKIGLKNLESGMDEQAALQLVKARNGELNDITRPSLASLRNNLKETQIDVDLMLTDKKRYENSLLAKDEDYKSITESIKNAKTKEEKESLEIELQNSKDKVLKSNDHWLKLSQDYYMASTKHSNAQSAVNHVYTQANAKLNPAQKKGSDMYRELLEDIPNFGGSSTTLDQDITSLEKAIRNLPGGKEIIPKEGINQIGVGTEETENFLISKYLELKGYKVDNNSRADRSIFNWIGDKKLGYDSKIIKSMRDGRGALNNTVEKILKANPRAESFKVITSETLTGKRAPMITRANDLLKEAWKDPSTRDNAQVAYSGEKFTDDMIEDMVGSSEDGYDFIPSMTDSWDVNGKKFINVTVINKETDKMSTIQILDESNKANDIAGARQLMNSNDPSQQALGKRIIAGYEHMSNVKLSGMKWKDTGEIAVNGLETKSGKKLTVSWEKSPDGDFYTASINGKPINDGQAIYGENDMTEVIYDYIESLKSKNEQ